MPADRIDWQKVTDPSELEGFSQFGRQDQRLIGDSLRALRKRVAGGGNGTVRIDDSFEYKPDLRGVAKTLHQAGIGLNISPTRDERGRIVITPKTFEELEAEKESLTKKTKTGIPGEYKSDPTQGRMSDFLYDFFAPPKK